jgi:hypothetical protein
MLDGPASDLTRPGARRGSVVTSPMPTRTATGRKHALRHHDPVLIIAGADDPIVASTGKSTVLIVDGTGHFPQPDCPPRSPPRSESFRAATRDPHCSVTRCKVAASDANRVEPERDLRRDDRVSRDGPILAGTWIAPLSRRPRSKTETRRS